MKFAPSHLFLRCSGQDLPVFESFFTGVPDYTLHWKGKRYNFRAYAQWALYYID